MSLLNYREVLDARQDPSVALTALDLLQLDPYSPDFACSFCHSAMRHFYTEFKGGFMRRIVDPTHDRISDYGEEESIYLVCQTCGWWCVVRKETRNFRSDQGKSDDLKYGACWGALKKLDLSNRDLPIEQVQSYLLAKYEDRNDLDWGLLEDLVAQVFRDFGCIVEQTSRSKDNGIDLILFKAKKGETVGVQVKRQSKKIGIDQIKVLYGSLHDQDHAEGIYVTTSDYTRGSKKIANRFIELGTPIKLVDALQLYETLGVTARPSYVGLDLDQLPFEEFDVPFRDFLGNPHTIPQVGYEESIFYVGEDEEDFVPMSEAFTPEGDLDIGRASAWIEENNPEYFEKLDDQFSIRPKPAPTSIDPDQEFDPFEDE